MERSLESFEKHLREKVGTCCQSWLLLSYESLLGREYIAVPQRCKSNYCPTCRKHNLHTLRQMLINSMKQDRWRLITLTFPNHNEDPETVLKESYSTFKKFTNRLRRRTKAFKYVRVLELHKSGFPHFHVVVNRYMPYQLIKEAWKEVGGGHVDIRSAGNCRKCGKKPPCEHIKHPLVAGYKQAARYLTEEIEKKIQDPHQLGYTMWKHRIRTICTSRSIRLQIKRQQYNFEGKYNGITELVEHCRSINRLNELNGLKPIGMVAEGNAIKIGHGFEHIPKPWSGEITF